MSEEDKNDCDVRHIEDLFISKYRINVAGETSVDEKEKKTSPYSDCLIVSSFSLAFFLFAAYRWSISGSSTVYLKKRSLIDSSLVMLSLYIYTNRACNFRILIYVYTDDAVCCPFDYLLMRNPSSIRLVCVYVCVAH